jgi:hypothetical protein
MTLSRFYTRIDGASTWAQALVASAGAADANKIVATGGNGRLDQSLLPIEIGSMATQSASNVNITGGSIAVSAVTATHTNSFVADTASGINAQLVCSTAGSVRWSLGKNSAVESGGQVGSNFFIARFSDAGVLVDTPFYIIRSSGVAGFTNSILTPGLQILSNGMLQTNGIGYGSVAGNSRGLGALDLQGSRSAATQVASGAYSVLMGISSTASNIASIAIGNNSISSNTNTIAIGLSNIASGASAITIGDSCNAAGVSAISIGKSCTAAGANAIAIGTSSSSSADNALSTGRGALGRLQGFHAHSSGTFANTGDAQTLTGIVRGISTDAALTELISPARITLVNDSTVFFDISVIGRRTDADNDSAAFRFVGAIDRNTNAASTALVGTVTKTVIARDSVAWDVTVDADPSNGSLRIQVQGEAAKSIRWAARAQLTEIVG